MKQIRIKITDKRKKTTHFFNSRSEANDFMGVRISDFEVVERLNNGELAVERNQGPVQSIHLAHKVRSFFQF